MLNPANVHSADSVPLLTSSSAEATAGFYTLSWQAATAEQSQIFELEESDNPEFNTTHLLYRGPDMSSVLSGMSNGTRYYRVRNRDLDNVSAWSNTVSVEVAHHPLSRALGFLAVGVVVFLATVLMILLGSRKTQ